MTYTEKRYRFEFMLSDYDFPHLPAHLDRNLSYNILIYYNFNCSGYITLDSFFPTLKLVTQGMWLRAL